MAIVITDSIGGAEIRHPTGLQQWYQPCLVLAGNGDRSGNRNGERTTGANRAVKNTVNAAQNRASERRKAVFENLMDGLAFIDAAHTHRFSLIGMHLYEFRIRVTRYNCEP